MHIQNIYKLCTGTCFVTPCIHARNICIYFARNDVFIFHVCNIYIYIYIREMTYLYFILCSKFNHADRAHVNPKLLIKTCWKLFT